MSATDPSTAAAPQVTDRNTVMRTIRVALRDRSGKDWSVTGGKGTGWGWITITAPPRRRDAHGCMTPEDIAELTALLSLRHLAHPQGITIPDGNDYYAEYLARAKGDTPTRHGTPDWD